MIDAWGKLPSGLLRGNFKWPGEWNECIQQKANRTTGSGLLEGAWSMVGIQLPSSIMPASLQAPVSSTIFIQLQGLFSISFCHISIIPPEVPPTFGYNIERENIEM